MKKIIGFLVLYLFVSSISLAQNEIDALNFSKTRPFGTGMALGTAGALGSVGSDMGSYSINPAGLGFYRQNEFNISMGLVNPSTKSDYLGLSMSDNLFGFTIPNVSYTYTKLLHEKGQEKDDELVSYNFTAQVNRNSDFYNKTFYQGKNTQSSFLDKVWEDAQGRPDENSLNAIEWLAYRAYLLDLSDSFPGEWFIQVADKRSALQTGIIETRGGMYNWNVGGSFNYGNILYGGLSLNYSILRKKEVNIFREDNDYFDEGFKDFTLRQDINSNGNGFGVKAGVIFRPIEELRIGFSFHSPEKMRITENFSYEMASTFDPSYPYAPPYMDNKVNDPDSDNEKYKYKYYVRTPSRVTISASYVTGKFGFLSLDFERVDYRNINMGSEFDDYLLENTYIKSDFRQTYNVRLGGELLLGKDVRLRAGLAHYSSPYKKELSSLKNDFSEWSLSTGFGIRKKEFGFDFGIMHSGFRDKYFPYFSQDPYPSSSVVRKHGNVFINASLIFFIDPD